MTRAELCIPRTLIHEGGFVDHPSDPGGATNKGITIATFRRYVKPRGTVADLKALTTAQAVVVYKRQYWDRVMADMLPHGVDYTAFDYATNSGPTQCVKDLQRVVGATVDGRIGPQTIAAVRAMDPKVVIRQLCARRLALMRGLKGGKLWATFGRGWQKRVDRVLADSLADVVTLSHPDPQEVTSNPLAAIFSAIAAFFAAIRKGRS